MDQTRGVRFGIVVQCEGGYFAGMNGGAVYDNNDKLVMKFPGDGGAGHMPNFLGTVRSRRVADLVAPCDVAHTGASLCHFGNISYRIGATAGLGQVRASLEAVPAAGKYLDGLAKNLGANGVDLSRDPFRLGQWIQAEGDNIAQVESGSEAALERARFLLRETHRPPYAIPDQV